MDCEFQIEIQFNKHRVEHAVDEPLTIYLLKLKTKLDAVYQNDKDNDMVSWNWFIRLKDDLGSRVIWAWVNLLK